VAAAAAVPGAVLHLPAPHWTSVVAYTLGLGLALVWWRRRETVPIQARWAGVAALIMLAAAVSIATWPLVRPADARLHVTVLDVGQGDAIVVETPDGKALLIDAGPGGPMRLDTGERVVAPFLWNRGILRLAAATTTHDDRDHAGGMAAIQRHFTISEPLTPGERTVGGAIVRAFYPDDGPAPLIRRNDHALVVRVEYGSAAFLLASDIDGPAEARLLTAGAPLPATVLKVAHHGSRSSSTEAFLRRVQPAYAAVSVGARNPYGHPAAETVARLTATGARVYRTDRDGALLFETDGRSLWVTRWASGQTERYCLDPDGVC
jgi:competence protein ComEC